MQKRDLEVQLLTPVWTGNSAMVPDGLKMSGVIGSMRDIFERLIRSHGGHTCNITGEAGKRCNYEKDKNICPACAVFGCTGWARTFKLNWELQPFNRIGTILLPETDRCPRFRNRHASEECYPGLTSIDTWMASVVNGKERGTIQPGQHDRARQVLTQMRPAYAADPKTRQRIPSSMEILVMRPHAAYDIGTLIAGLLSYMGDRYAIGAKVNQGWGFFDVVGADHVDEKVFSSEMAKLIADTKAFSHRDWDASLPNAKDIPRLEPIEVDMPNLFGQFGWGPNVALNRYPFDFLPLGFALQYRLRRIVKFWAQDCREEDADAYSNLLGGGGEIDVWAETHKREITSYLPKHPLSWQEEGAFAEYLFGKSSGNDKMAGKIGVSHPYRLGNKWYVRMISTAEEQYTNYLHEILEDQVNGGELKC